MTAFNALSDSEKNHIKKAQEECLFFNAFRGQIIQQWKSNVPIQPKLQSKEKSDASNNPIITKKKSTFMHLPVQQRHLTFFITQSLQGETSLGVDLLKRQKML